ncbi:serine carboxypeptidase-like 18 [Artemisia annua]|uniref:Serine carboxypeptidase-like 18 n=1 Tax=Artemisia annua TaxID=35608 RepID=A0A2U1NA74_ARTAN|nr:serine carboxypeptidase-like 18 [Artemisia annua]
MFVREALHIHEEFGDTEWVRCNDSMLLYDDKKAASYIHSVPSSVDYHRRLSDKKCRALIYSGDHDMIVPYLSTLRWIESLNLPVVDDWRPWLVDKQVAGTTMKPRSQFCLQPWDLYNKSRSGVSRMVFAVLVLLASMEVIESQFLVKTLPGFVGDLPFTLETGYIGVGESDEVQLFYYFIESEGNPNEDPLMLWLTGGPGCSGLSGLFYEIESEGNPNEDPLMLWLTGGPGCSGLSGLFYEIGPLTIDYANSTLEKARLEINPYSWTKAASILFLDQPAGTGFAYAKTSEAYITNDTSSTIHTYNFLTKGYVLGNPLTDTSAGYNSRIPYAHNMALLSDAIYKSTKENCHGEYWNVDPNNSLCVHDLDVVDKCLGRIRLPHILEPYCETTDTLTSDLYRRGLGDLDEASVDIWSLLPQVQTQWCRDDNYLYSSVWANSKDVREALHIREEFGETEWVRCNDSMHFYFDKEAIAYTHNVMTVVSYHRNLNEVQNEVLHLYEISEFTVDCLLHDLSKMHIYKDKMKELLNKAETDIPKVPKLNGTIVMSSMLGLKESTCQK